MRILQVAPFYPPHVGGIEFHVEALSRKLVEAGHHVTVFTSNVPRGRTHEVVDGVEIYRFRCWFAPINNPFLPGLAGGLLRHHDFDVIHSHGHFHLSTTVALFSNLFLGKRFVVSCHGAVLALRGWRKVVEIVFNKTVGLWTLRSADKVIALTPSLADILVELGAKPGKLTVIPLWIDGGTTALPPDIDQFRRTYGLGGRRIVLFVGRILPVKGLEYLIEAAAQAASRPAVLIIGDQAPGYAGTKDDLVRKVRELHLENDVFFLGRFSRDELTAAYAAADLFVLPSLGEGLPTALLEAMAHGKCVVATDAPGNRDVVKDGWNGLLVEPRNPVQLARRIDHALADDGLRETLGGRARSDIEQNYSPDVILAQILDAYDEAQRGGLVI